MKPYNQLNINEKINLKSWYCLCKYPLKATLKAMDDEPKWNSPKSWFIKIPHKCCSIK